MSALDGGAATRAIGSIERTHSRPRTPIFMQKANTLPHHDETSREAGTDLHLEKSVTLAALFNSIEQIDRAHEPTHPVSMASG